MLNMKKGLAIVLAAATAITFAPVSTAFAATGDPTDDGLTTTAGIDSKPADISLTKSDTTTWKTIHIMEHEGKSQKGTNGTEVGALRVTIQRHLTSDNVTYEDVVDVSANKGTNTLSRSTKYTSSAAGADTLTEADKTANKLSTTTYLIPYTAPTRDTDNKWSNLGGADLSFKSTNKASGTYTVTVSTLATMDEAADNLDTSTFTITIPGDGEVFKLQSTPSIMREGANQKVIWTRTNNLVSNYLEVRTDNEDVAWVYRDTKANEADLNLTSQSSSDGSTFLEMTSSANYGTFTVGSGVRGTARIDVLVKKNIDDSDTEAVAQFHFTVKVTPKNGKLRVTYNIQNGQNAEQRTYTDDQEYYGESGNESIRYADSDTYVVDNKGNLKIDDVVDQSSSSVDYLILHDTTAKTGTEHKLIQNASGQVYNKSSNTWVAAPTDGAASSAFTDLATSVEDVLGKTAVQQIKYSHANYLVKSANLPMAQLLSQNGQKTVQISAVSQVASSQDISYALVEYKGHYTPGVGGAAPTADSTVTAGKDKYSYFENASDKGSISRTGLVTLKDSYHSANLYAVVTVKGANATKDEARRDTSTYIIPISGSVQEPVSFFASDEKGYAEVDVKTSADNYRVTGTKTIYLSTKDHPTDTLKYYGNISEDYVTGSVADPSIVKFDQQKKTLTAVKAGETELVLKTLPAPDHAGTVIATFRVVVNDHASNNAVTLTPVSVNRSQPTARIQAETKVAGTEAVFDSDYLYVEDANTPSHFRKVTAEDTEYNAITVSTTGYVTYNKNNGSVYVRAYSPATDTVNPAGYTYVKVTFGQSPEAAKTENDLKVTSDENVKLSVGDTSQITATTVSGGAITYSSDDSSVASVGATDGKITAIKAGSAIISVTAAGSDTQNPTTKYVKVTVSNKTVAPTKVTGLKVKNKKGAKVSVTWTAQDKTVLYRVYKKVGNGSWKAKNVTNAKATLEVKKGAKVQVKVKAFRRDENGKAVWGPKATKAKTFKTDKK